MIVPLIIILSLALILLLIDWQGLARRFPALKRIWESRQQRTVTPKREPRPLPQTASKRPIADEEQHFLADAMQAPQTEEQLERTSQNPEVQELLDKADVFFRKGELKAAEQHYLQAAAKDPRCSKAYSRLGIIYLETGEDWQDAEDAFRQALKTDGNNGYILNNLGLVLYHQDKFADAIRHFELAVRQDEFNANRHANLGKAYMAMRQYAKAESSFKKALKLEPNELEYKDLLAEAIEKKQAHKAMLRR
jgi:Tfp pilus assembly protein PilF